MCLAQIFRKKIQRPKIQIKESGRHMLAYICTYALHKQTPMPTVIFQNYGRNGDTTRLCVCIFKFNIKSSSCIQGFRDPPSSAFTLKKKNVLEKWWCEWHHTNLLSFANSNLLSEKIVENLPKPIFI